MKKKASFSVFMTMLTFLILATVLSSCGGGGDVGTSIPASTTNWLWMSGSNIGKQVGIYGTKGVAAPNNVPGARVRAISWIDSNDNLWLFGGSGLDSAGDGGLLNDLWKFDGTNWTWVSGSNIRRQVGIYGTKGVAAPSNVPGARCWAVSWIDKSGNLWLFGGDALDAVGRDGQLNDLWKFDGTNWTWVSGSSSVGRVGIYGTKGVAAPNNVPGCRWSAASWIDSSDNLWLFGGLGCDSVNGMMHLNDLWKFDGTNWTWMSGSNIGKQVGIYGTKGVAAPNNVPGARVRAISWIDSNDNLWLFGGSGFDLVEGNTETLNDLWKFDGTNWTWVSGSNVGFEIGIYGTKGSEASNNVPGAREEAVSWIDSSDNLWLFGGLGCDSKMCGGLLNDLWKFDGTNWIWISGSKKRNQSGSYGTKGEAGANIPGARFGSISWIDSNDNLWLFGGSGLDSAGDNVGLNDLWQHKK
ncbi:MAG: galactose oxidase [Deltaproteobacteria bacterium]